LITVSDYALPAEQMPGNAAALVEYLNSPADAAHPWAMKRKEWGHPEPFRVRWFELGNESMHGNHRVIPHRQYSAEEYAAYANAVASAMRRVDPSIKLGIVTVPGPGNDADSDWNQTVVRLAGRSADFVVLHIYAPLVPTTGASSSLLMQAMLVTPEHVEERLRTYHQMIRRQLGHDLPLAVTEYNGALNESAFRLSYANALECADLLRVFFQPEANVALAAYWQFLNGPFGMLHTSETSFSGEPATEAPALSLYQLWAQHFGAHLVKVNVQSPRASFPGLGSEEASYGTTPQPRRELESVDLDRDSSFAGTLWPRLLNVQIQRQNTSLTIHLHHLTRSIYPLLARIPRPSAPAGAPLELSISFDARFTPDPGSSAAPMGLGLIDSRGWSATHSGIGVDTITTQSKHFQATYQLVPQTAAVDLQARLMADGADVSGTLQVQHLAITAFASGHDAAYPVLTSSASLSTDGRTLYLMVINKSAGDSIDATIHLNGFSASGAHMWEVNGPSLGATGGVAEIAHGAALHLTRSDLLDHVFPAHSMSAIEFSRSR
jgi:alpha-N-arabinofuranosidase